MELESMKDHAATNLSDVPNSRWHEDSNPKEVAKPDIAAASGTDTTTGHLPSMMVQVDVNPLAGSFGDPSKPPAEVSRGKFQQLIDGKQPQDRSTPEQLHNSNDFKLIDNGNGRSTIDCASKEVCDESNKPGTSGPNRIE